MGEDVVRFFGIPERIELDDGVVLRRYVQDDLPQAVAVVNANLDHLSPWMPWAQQPVTMESQREWLAAVEKDWQNGTGFGWGVFDAEGRNLGGVGFHVRNGPGVLEIGYWLAADVVGQGLMTRIAEALTTVAGTVEGVRSVEIHCDAANTRSAAIPQRLGYALVRVEDRDVSTPGESGRHLIFARAV